MKLYVGETEKFKKIQDAINSIPVNNNGQIEIFISNGIYKEKIKIEKPNIRLIGQDVDKTIITYDDCAAKILPDGSKMGTFNSYTVYIGDENFIAENITFENSAGSGLVVGQAVAVYVDADKAVFKNCSFLGFQDTLFTGPLPNDPIPVGINALQKYLLYGQDGFEGVLRHYFEDCYIEGDVDFIFGSARAVFNKCEIFSKNRNEKINGFITAGSHRKTEQYGYVFIDCKLTSDADPGTVFLGRPWRDYANVKFINCWMDKHIIDEGWDNWDNVKRESTSNYSEFGSYGPGANDTKRVKWSNILKEDKAILYTIENILSGDDKWNPLMD